MENWICWNAVYPEIGILFPWISTIIDCWVWIWVCDETAGISLSLSLEDGMKLSWNWVLPLTEGFLVRFTPFIIMTSVLSQSSLQDRVLRWIAEGPSWFFPALPPLLWEVSSAKTGSKHSTRSLFSGCSILTTTMLGSSSSPEELNANNKETRDFLVTIFSVRKHGWRAEIADFLCSYSNTPLVKG